ncbi:MAG: YibE/F family protein [Mycobacteriales bacterium]
MSAPLQSPRLPPGGLRAQRALIGVVATIALATLAGLVLLWPQQITGSGDVPARGDRVRATATAVAETPCNDTVPGGGAADPTTRPGATKERCLQLQVRLDDGPEKGQSVLLRTGEEPGVQVGRGVVLIRAEEDLPLAERYQYADVQRGRQLFALVGLFAVAVIALGRRRGALALVGLGISLVIIVKFLVPALLSGRPPVLTAVVGASAVMLVVLLLAHGPGIRTATAIAGTGTSLLLIVALSSGFVALTGLSGLTSDDDYLVQAFFGQALDLRGLLLAGIVIGALGILDDVTVTQVSLVWELRDANPTMARRDLHAAALRVGRDHIASTVNTLLLAYAGASLPLLVIFTTAREGFLDSVTTDVVAQEVVRTLVGSIGLVAAVPITTALATWMCPAPLEALPDPVPARVSLPASPLDEDRLEDDPHSWGPRAAGEQDPPSGRGPS